MDIDLNVTLHSNDLTPICSASLEILMTILDQVGMKDILACRATSHQLFRASVATLRHNLKAMLSPFVVNVDEFCAHLDRQRTLIGGLFALAFFIRDKSFPVDLLELYAPDQLYPGTVEAVSDHIRGALEYISVTATGTTFPGRDVSECTHFRLTTGRSIVVYQSSDWTAMSPITRSPCTALINYVTPTSFGCAYPQLTFRRRALLADHSMVQPLPLDFYIMNLLTEEGFDVSWSPVRFHRLDGGRIRVSQSDLLDRTSMPTLGDMLLHKHGDHPATPLQPLRPSWGTPAAWERYGWPYPRHTRCCYAYKRMCPKQTRYFADPTWLMDFFDPLSVDRHALQSQYRVPYGTVVAWKLWSSYRCSMGHSCDQIIPEKLFFHDGFVKLPALPGDHVLDRRRPLEHPPVYLYRLG